MLTFSSMQDEVALGAIRCTLAEKGMANGGRFSRADARTIEMERRIVNYAARFLFRSGPAILEFRVCVCAHYDHSKEEKKEGRVETGGRSSTLNFLWIHVALLLCRNGSNDSF